MCVYVCIVWFEPTCVTKCQKPLEGGVQHLLTYSSPNVVELMVMGSANTTDNGTVLITLSHSKSIISSRCGIHCASTAPTTGGYTSSIGYPWQPGTTVCQ